MVVLVGCRGGTGRRKPGSRTGNGPRLKRLSSASKRRTTLREVAERAGVSVATVSNVLNNRPGTGAPTVTRVLEAAAALDYRPDRAARALTARRRRSAGPAAASDAPRLSCLGYLSVDFTAGLAVMPHRDDRITASRIRKTVGGPAANVAATAAGLGEPYSVEAVLVTVTGDDDDSDWAIDRLAERGVRVTSIGRRPGGRLSRCLVLVEAHGSRTIINEPLGLDVDRAVARILEGRVAAERRHCLLLEGFQYGAATRHFARLREAGITLAVHSTGLPTASRTTADFLALLAAADIVFVNRDVAQAVTGFRGARIGLVDRLEALWRAAPEPRPVLAFTLGDEGVVVWEEGRASGLHIPARPVEPVDATGAGDTFAGIFLAAWLNGAGTVGAARLAVAGATLSVTCEGAQECRPSAAELEARLAPEPARPPSLAEVAP